MVLSYLSSIGPAISIFIATLALVLAVLRYLGHMRMARLSFAKSLYKDYLKLAMDNERFSSASYPKNAPIYNSIRKDPVEHERYVNFVSFMLFAAEEILEINSTSVCWHSTLIGQLKKHANYLESEHFKPHDWSEKLVELCEVSIKSYRNDF